MDALHFLRPAWFFALAPLAGLLVLLWRRRRAGRSWQAVVDPRLLPYLLTGKERRHGPWGIAAVAMCGLLAVTALAGPVWSKLEQPVFRRESALVVLLDLSRSMKAADLQPNRLRMAKFKLRDILARRKEGETALVVYAADPFVVTPLTNDVDTIARQLSSLTPDLMPAQGSRTDRAVDEARKLLQQAGAARGDVLLITDGVDNDPPAALRAAVKNLLDAGYRLSVLGVGSDDGAPIPVAGGGFFKDAAGAIVMPKLDQTSLKRLAAEGHGIYRRLAMDDSDTQALIGTFDSGWTARQSRKVAGMKSDQWREEGPWLLLPLLPLAALAFRRGYLLLLCLAVLLPVPHSAYAFDWSGLWQRPDQRGAHALAARQPRQAAKLFRDPSWRAAAHYRAGDYQAALNDLKGHHDAAADYNRGNTLAHLGKFDQALNAYNEALKHDPGFKDAEYNRDLVKKWLQARRGKPSSSNSAAKGGRQGHMQRRGQTTDRQQYAGAQGTQRGQGRHSSAPRGKDQAGAQANSSNGGKGAASPLQQKQKSAGKSAAAAGKDARRHRQGDADRRTAMNDARPQSPAAGTEAGRPSESEQATEQWLRRIPDDPGGLWRRKFLYQYKREYQAQQNEAKPW